MARFGRFTTRGSFGYKLLPTITPGHEIFGVLFFSTFLLELAADYQMTIIRRNNLVFYHIMTVLQYVFLALLFRENIVFNRSKQLLVISIVGVVLGEIVLIVYVQGFNQSPSLIRLITRLLYLYWILTYLRTLLIAENPVPLLSIPMFWFCLGLLVYYICFLQVGIRQYMIDKTPSEALFWYYFSLWFDFLFYLISTYALWLAARQPRYAD